MKRLCSLLGLLCVVGLLPVAAQSIAINPKPGKVSEAEVSMTTYPRDTSAAAVVLMENTIVMIQTSDVLELTKEVQVYERIKVLKEDGKSWADYKIPYYKDENVTNVKVTTYNLENGKVKQSSLDKKHIFKEEVTSGLYTCSFSAPDVRVGSVIEVSYKLNSDRYWDIPEFVLQRTIPVNMVYSALLYPDFLGMNKMSRGYITAGYKKTESPLVLRNNVIPQCSMITEQYSLIDAPAVPREPSNMSPRHYRCAIAFELASVTIPGRLYKSYSMKWDDVDKQVRESNISSQCTVKGKVLDPFVSHNEDEDQAIADVRNAVLAAVKWNGDLTMVPDNIRNVIKAGTGASASINAIVASVLNQMGYRVYPTLLCRRSNGSLASFYVSPEAFTSMIIRIETPSGKVHFLDAAPDYGYLNIIDTDFLVEEARVVLPENEGVSFWENLTTIASGATVIVATGELQEDNTVKGTIDLKAFKESSYMVKETRDVLGTDEKYFQLVEKGEDFEIISGEYQADPYSPNVGLTLEYEQQATATGEFVYIKPFLIKEHHQGDFPPGERHLPIDFPFKETITYTYTMQVPEGYAVEQLPANVSYQLSGYKARVACQSQLMDGNIIKISYTFKNDTLQIPASSYPDLRTFWEKLCNIYLGTIILKKV